MLTRTTTTAVIALALGAVVPMFTACTVMGEDEAALDETEARGGRVPVIWVHGCAPPVATHEMISHFTDPQRDYFRSKGYPDSLLYRFVFSGAQCGSNLDYARELSDLVDQALAESGAPRVDIVAHSMGAVATRLYLLEGGASKVQDVVTIAGTNHGAQQGAAGVQLQAAFGYPAYEGMKEMYPPYACDGQTSGGAADVQAAVNGCLTPTGRTEYVDETASSVRFLALRNTQDEEVTPVESGCLNQAFQNDCSDRVNAAVSVPPGPGPCGPNGCPAHVTVLWDQGVMKRVFDHVSVD